MRRIIGPCFRALISFAFWGTASSGCADDAVEPEKRLSTDELLEFYTEFCARWQECTDAFSWSSAAECADVQVDYYNMLPTGCLNTVVDYHQCTIQQECAIFENATLGGACAEAKDAIRQVDCGGLSAP